jgi:hypothetical protein
MSSQETGELTVSVRSYRTEDEEAVIDLWHRCGLVVPWNDPRRDIEIKMQFQPELFLVGTLDGRPIASVMVGYEGHRGGSTTWRSARALGGEASAGR